MGEIMQMCCDTCKSCMLLERLDYSNGGCEHEVMEGYACMAFEDEGQVNWMVGLDRHTARCEQYEPKEG